MTCGNNVSGDTQAETHGEPDPEQIAKLQAELGADYVVERELGRGGMAIVYLGQDVHIGRRVAIKLLPPELMFGHGSAFVDRFKREARTAGTLDHPNIIPIFRVSSGGKLFWYVMKYVEGESLQATLDREGQMSVKRVTTLLTPVADALDYAHRKSVIHRDVKPANILVDSDAKVTVTDFGIAKALGANSLTGSGSLLGTPHYMSPEQCSGTKLTGASDQYSLAVTAYQMFAGKVPFTGDSAVGIIKHHMLDDPPPLRDLRPDLHERVTAAIDRGLAKRAEERFASVSDFVSALQAAGAPASATRSAKAPPPKPQVRVAPRTPPDIRLGTGTAGAPRPRGIRWYEAVAAVALGFGMMLLWLKSSQPNAAAKADSSRVRPDSTAQAFAPAAETGKKTAPVETKPAARLDTPATKVPADRPPPTTNQGARQSARAGNEVKKPERPVVAPKPARLALRVTPIDAIVMRNGAPVRGDTVVMPAGRHLISVERAGYRGWSELVTVKDGEQLTRIVTLEAIPAPRVEQPPAARTETPPSGPANPPPKVTGPARIFVGTNIPAEIRVNGKATANPVNNLEVPAGAVTIRFIVTDSMGTWETDSAVTVAADAVFRRRFQLGRVPAGARTQPGAAGAGAPSGTAPPRTGRIYVGTNIPATLSVNGMKTSNPVNNMEVAAGSVRIHFEVRDEQGAWETDSTLAVAAGAVVRKRFQLKRP